MAHQPTGRGRADRTIHGRRPARPAGDRSVHSVGCRLRLCPASIRRKRRVSKPISSPGAAKPRCTRLPLMKLPLVEPRSSTWTPVVGRDQPRVLARESGFVQAQVAFRRATDDGRRRAADSCARSLRPDTPRNTYLGSTGRTAVAPGSSLAGGGSGTERRRRRGAAASIVDNRARTRSKVTLSPGRSAIRPSTERPLTLTVVPCGTCSITPCAVTCSSQCCGSTPGRSSTMLACGIGTDPVDARAEQDLRVFAPGKTSFIRVAAAGGRGERWKRDANAVRV